MRDLASEKQKWMKAFATSYEPGDFESFRQLIQKQGTEEELTKEAIRKRYTQKQTGKTMSKQMYYLWEARALQ